MKLQELDECVTTKGLSSSDARCGAPQPAEGGGATASATLGLCREGRSVYDAGRMRIGINALYLIPGGVGGTETYLRNLVRALERIDHTNEYLIYTNAESAGTFELTAPNFREVGCPLRAVHRPARIVWEQTVIPVQAKLASLDVLHSPGYTAPLVLGCPSLVTIHDLNYHFFPEDWSPAALRANRVLIPLVARRATRILTVSHSSARAICQVLNVPTSKVDTVHLGIDGNLVASGAEDETKVRRKHGIEGRFILCVTASHPHKNLDGLLRAYDHLTRRWPEAPPLAVVGIKGRHQAKLEETLARRQGAGRVILTGWVDAKELAALYRAATLFVFPSKYEGFGFPVLEAMSAGTPVVSSNSTSLPELVGDAGLLVDPDNHVAMAEAMHQLIDDERLRRELIERGTRRARRFTWDAAAASTLASYQAARGTGGGA
jgi:glycosyltransferase involved in cell wall biosynthesis